MQFMALYIELQNAHLVEIIKEEKYLMVFVASYLVSTIVLIGDLDLVCQRTFPLNYVLWLAQSACISYITCYIGTKLNPYLVLCMLMVLMIVTIVNAIFGMLDCRKGASCCNKMQWARVATILLVTAGIAFVLAPKDNLNFHNYPGIMPNRDGAKPHYAKLNFAMILCAWGFYVMLF